MVEQTPKVRFALERLSISYVIWLMAAIYLAAHVPFLPKTPYDLDAVNFTLALHDYDLTKHQPHPPGSPVFVGLGRMARMAMGSRSEQALPSTASRTLDTAALGIWSACFGALAAFGIFRLFAGIGESPARAVLATALTLATPLFWFSGVRPMSDLPGLALALLALGLIAPSLMRNPVRTQSRMTVNPLWSGALLLGCFAAGLAPGMRVQMAALTWPAALVAITMSARRHDRFAFLSLGSFILGVVVWLLPLTVIVGGPAEYLRLLRLQAAEDVTGGQMLALTLSVRDAVQALHNSFVAPWGESWLGLIAIAAAVVGAGHLLGTRPRIAATLALVFGPYSVLHLVFQDTSHVRYALPLTPLVALLAVHGFAALGQRLSTAAPLGLVAASLAIAFTSVVTHSSAPAPVYQALDAVRSGLTTDTGQMPVLAMHHSVGLALRGEHIPTRVLPSPLRYEWLELAKYWRDGGEAPVWFLASRRRTDLALVDRTSRSLVRSFPYPARSGALLAGARPRTVDWVEVRRPGWVALEGWSLTPEVRGVTVREYMRNRPPKATALLKRRPDEVAILLGGRNLGGPCATGALVKVSVDGREIDRFGIRAGESFARLWRLPPGTLNGNGRFADLEIAAEDRSGAGQQVDVAFEQFDVQGPGQAIAGLTEGWFEPEYEIRDGAGYRWMSDRAAVRVDSFYRDVTLRLRGESPRRYFAQPSTIRVRAGSEILDIRQLDTDFEFEVRVPVALLTTNGGVIEIEASQSFVPHERSGNGDRRVLALRIFEIDVRAREALLERVDAQSVNTGGPDEKAGPQ